MKKFCFIFVSILLLFSGCSSNEESCEIFESEELSSQIIEKETVESSTIEESGEQEIMFEKALDMTFEFTKDGIDKPGFAQGIISITPLSNALNFGYYIVYFASDEYVLY